VDDVRYIKILEDATADTVRNHHDLSLWDDPFTSDRFQKTQAAMARAQEHLVRLDEARRLAKHLAACFERQIMAGSALASGKAVAAENAIA
jgi:hypothetical protein